jgi:hypothetical protein
MRALAAVVVDVLAQDAREPAAAAAEQPARHSSRAVLGSARLDRSLAESTASGEGAASSTESGTHDRPAHLRGDLHPPLIGHQDAHRQALCIGVGLFESAGVERRLWVVFDH